jgi:hypothetical protein
MSPEHFLKKKKIYANIFENTGTALTSGAPPGSGAPGGPMRSRAGTSMGGARVGMPNPIAYFETSHTISVQILLLTFEESSYVIIMVKSKRIRVSW